MAVFGNLQDFMLTDIFRVVSKRKGRLQIHLAEENTYDLFLDSNVLNALLINNEPEHEMLKLRSSMLHLMRARNGIFLFAKTYLDNYRHDFDIALDQVVLNGLNQLMDIKRDSAKLPHELMDFVLVSESGAWVDPEIEQFLDQCRDELRQGCNALLLSKKTGLDIEFVRLNFFKLKAAGMINPRRRAPIVRPRPPKVIPPNHQVTPAAQPRVTKPLPAGKNPAPGSLTQTRRFTQMLGSLKDKLLKHSQLLKTADDQ